MIGSLSLGALEDDLADSNTRPEDKRKRSQVPDLQNLTVIDSGLNKPGRHMNDQPHSSKAASSFKPTTYIRREFNPFMGDS
jgi:hypothetical protein